MGLRSSRLLLESKKIFSVTGTVWYPCMCLSSFNDGTTSYILVPPRQKTHTPVITECYGLEDMKSNGQPPAFVGAV